MVLMKNDMYRQLTVGSIKPAGWLLEHIRRELNGFTGHLDELTARCRVDIFVKRNVEKKVDQQWWSYWWEGESEGNWMEGLIQSAWLAGPHPAREKCEYSCLIDPGAMDKLFTFERQSDRTDYPWEKPAQKITALLANTEGRLFTDHNAKSSVELLRSEGQLDGV